MSQQEFLHPAPVLVELTRGGIVEVSHRGHAVIVDAAGEQIYVKGNPDHVTFLRSSAKPFQAAAVIISGAAERFGLTEKEIAILAGSHGGESMHTETVTGILAKGNLGSDKLQCGVHPPLDEETRYALTRSGNKPTSLHHNCSGKHSGMLLNALHFETPVEDYLNPEQPGQKLITKVIAETAGIDEKEIIIGIDGCSAPVHGISVKAIARLFARLVRPVGLSEPLAQALLRVSKAMRNYPEMVAASRARICTELMRIGQNEEITAKAGAEGVYGVGWMDADSDRAFGLGVKMEDGQQRGRDSVTLALMKKYGAIPETLPESLEAMEARILKNWQGKVVGNTIAKI